MTRYRLKSVAIAFIGILIAGCGENYDNSGSGRDRDLNDTYRDDRDRDREKDRYDDRPRERDVPREATAIDEGVGKTLRHQPEHPGRAFLYDLDDRYTVYETRLKPGEKLVIDADKDSVKIDGAKQGKVNLRGKHRYRLYYLPDYRADDRKDRKRY